MSSLDAILEIGKDINEGQIKAITTTEGPLLIIAGPGTGKTLTIVLRTLYLLISEKAKPSEIILTTFTEKAAFEIRDRINQLAKKLSYIGQLHDLKIGTIHSICNEYISEYINHTPINKNYKVLDELTQVFFIYEHFDEIISGKINGKYFGRWGSKWTTIKSVIPYFNKITEELINPEDLLRTSDPFLIELSNAFQKYRKLLYELNNVDFAHLQLIFLELLNNPEIYNIITKKIKYIMVDEYQDTNYIQETIMLKLAEPENNICVVGDEDQALYRFRGATVRNILEFQKNFDNCKIVKLTVNYRSHKEIINRYNNFMNSIDWEGYRFEKKIIPNPTGKFPDYPAVFSIWGKDDKDEAERFADFVKFLKDNKIIQDYSQVALLLNSVRLQYSAHYIEALKRRNIPYFAPRAKAYFENEEVMLLVACYSIIFGFFGEELNEYNKKEYINNSIMLLKDYVDSPLTKYLYRKRNEIESLKENESLNLTILDYFYQLLAYKPFSDYLKDENKAHNLAIFSSFISIFQDYYNISVVSYSNRVWIKRFLFGSFLNFLIEGGADEYEDPNNPIPKGYVQIMTIHQSKGLEFPVVVVDSLDRQFRVIKQIDRDLGEFYKRGTFETEKQMTKFDRMRHFYVAFSRAEKILVLSTHKRPKDWFIPIWEGLDQWPYVKKDTLKALRFELKQQFVPKKSYSISAINVYETCPLQYLFYREYEFQPSRSAQILFGSLVHQTIEDVHKYCLEGKIDKITYDKIESWFNQNYNTLIATGLRPLAKTQKEMALKQVINYFDQNQDFLRRIKEAEVDVSVEKENYIIVGKIDLLLGQSGDFEILDFKTQPKPEENDLIMERYFNQLCLYAYILKERYNKVAKKLLIYWTAEEKKKDAVTEFYYTEKNIEEVGKHFDKIVQDIENKKFEIKDTPDVKKVCKECDFRYYCAQNGVIKYKTLESIEV